MVWIEFSVVRYGSVLVVVILGLVVVNFLVRWFWNFSLFFGFFVIFYVNSLVDGDVVERVGEL